MKKKFLSGRFFGVLEAIILLSYLTAPAPWATFTAYSRTTMIVSMVFGGLLATVVFLHVLLGVISHRGHMIFGALLGVASIVYAIVSPDRSALPRTLFAVYGAVLLIGSLFSRPVGVSQKRVDEEDKAKRQLSRAA